MTEKKNFKGHLLECFMIQISIFSDLHNSFFDKLTDFGFVLISSFSTSLDITKWMPKHKIIVILIIEFIV